MNRKPLTEKHMLDLVRAGAEITPEMWIAGQETGIHGMITAGLVFDADYLNKLPKATSRHMGFKI
jgi:hypothetical protein